MTPARLFAWYERGALTRHELLIRICQLATEFPPSEIVALLPVDILAEVREATSSPPKSREHCRIFGSVCATGDFDAKSYFNEESRRYFDGLWAWNRYFREQSTKS